MDLATMREEIRARLAEDEENYWSDAHILRAINSAVRRFAQEERWMFYLTRGNTVLVADTGELILDGTMDYKRHFDIVLQAVTSNTARDMLYPIRVDPRKGLRLRSAYYSTGRPEWYYTVQAEEDGTFATRIRFIPEPDVDYDVEWHYYRLPVPVALDDDEVDVPEEYVDAVVALATGNLWERELNWGAKAQEQFNLYNMVLEQARDENNSLADDEPLIWGGEQPLRGDYRQGTGGGRGWQPWSPVIGLPLGP